MPGATGGSILLPKVENGAGHFIFSRHENIPREFTKKPFNGTLESAAEFRRRSHGA
jgi:hypothetical protein